MSAVTLMRGAGLLQDGAKMLALIAGPESHVAAGMAASVRYGAAQKLLVGAEHVRGLGNPFFERMADDIVQSAGRVSDGAPVGEAISSAMEGATWLLRRVSSLA